MKDTLPAALLGTCLLMPVQTSPARSADGGSQTTDVEIVSQHFPPLQGLVEGKATGYVADTMMEVIRRIEARHPVRVSGFNFLPWKRAMETALHKPNVLFFSISRTPSREAGFHWLGEISPYGQNFYRLKSDHPISLDRLADLKDSPYRIGVQAGSNLQNLLDDMGISSKARITTYTDYHQGVKMLFRGRLDIIPLTSFLARASVCDMGLDGNRLEAVIPIKPLAKPLWAVLSRKTDPGLVWIFRKTLQAVKREGIHRDNIARHLLTWQKKPCLGNPDGQTSMGR